MKKIFLFILFLSIFGLVANFGYKWYRSENYYMSYLTDGRAISVKKDNPDLTQEDLDEIVENINNGTYYLEEKPDRARIYLSGPTIGFSE